ncbi:MAG: helix-turn-helix transcriptional regulator [Bacteroidia bacterium]|nr:helix-turn-helix transcriptional regulator [Bacteroidia bacterium]
MVLYIKNMVCQRCIMAVEKLASEAGITFTAIRLGELDTKEELLTEQKLADFDARLLTYGFERIDDKKSKIISRIKQEIIKRIHIETETPKVNWSVLLQEALHYEYHYLSSLFSSVEGITIEQYIIKQKIEKVKEWLIYDEWSQQEIADRLGYSSIAHLSSQFKKITGLTPSAFKKAVGGKGRKSLDSL